MVQSVPNLTLARPCAPDDVCVEVAYCGICGTDITEYLGGLIFPPQEGRVSPHTGVPLPVNRGPQGCRVGRTACNWTTHHNGLGVPEGTIGAYLSVLVLLA